MSNEVGDSPAPAEDSEELLFAQLEAYTQALQKRDHKTCQRILSESPEIEPFIGCRGFFAYLEFNQRSDWPGNRCIV